MMKKAIEWQPSFSVGILDLDAHHKGLIDYINILDDPKSYDSDQSHLIEETLENLEKYIHFHFSEEEEIMRKYDYPQIKEHIEEHKHFINEMASFRKSYENGNHNLAMGLASYLKGWFIRHILTIDKQYSEYFKEKGIEVH